MKQAVILLGVAALTFAACTSETGGLWGSVSSSSAIDAGGPGSDPFGSSFSSSSSSGATTNNMAFAFGSGLDPGLRLDSLQPEQQSTLEPAISRYLLLQLSDDNLQALYARYLGLNHAGVKPGVTPSTSDARAACESELGTASNAPRSNPTEFAWKLPSCEATIAQLQSCFDAQITESKATIASDTCQQIDTTKFVPADDSNNYVHCNYVGECDWQNDSSGENTELGGGARVNIYGWEKARIDALKIQAQ